MSSLVLSLMLFASTALAWSYYGNWWTPKPACQSVPADTTKLQSPNYIAEFNSRESYSNRPYLEVNGVRVSLQADAEVKTITPCTNYGKSTYERVQSYNYNTAVPREGSRIYLRANIPASVSSISSCRLYMYERWDSYLTLDSFIKVSEITSSGAVDSWTETGVTWNNQPCGLQQHLFNSNCNSNPLDSELITARNVYYSFDIQKACEDALSNPSRNVGLVLYAW